MSIKERMNEITELMAYLRKNYPEQLNAFMKLFEAISKGVLDLKTKELIAIALAVKAHCEWCIALHVKNSLDAGAKPEEIVEAAWIAVLMDGGPSLMYLIPVVKSLEEFTKGNNSTKN